ncbi:MAG: hypothetical protein PVG14_18795 [Anaerolineales bacterium]
MASPIITITAIASLLGFISNSTILSLVPPQPKKLYHLISIALVIAVFLPVKNRLEGFIEQLFAHRRLQF